MVQEPFPPHTVPLCTGQFSPQMLPQEHTEEAPTSAHVPSPWQAGEPQSAVMNVTDAY